jgi:hypothetical protein
MRSRSQPTESFSLFPLLAGSRTRALWSAIAISASAVSKNPANRAALAAANARALSCTSSIVDPRFATAPANLNRDS